jgi:hypothetical protein
VLNDPVLQGPGMRAIVVVHDGRIVAGLHRFDALVGLVCDQDHQTLLWLLWRSRMASFRSIEKVCFAMGRGRARGHLGGRFAGERHDRAYSGPGGR